jgi:uncharacterized repeat protein (TIGR01451 family)
MQELVTLLGSASVLALLVALVTCALGLRRRATRRSLSWAEALSQWWAWSSAASNGSIVLSPRHPRMSRVWRALLVLVWVVAVFLMPYQAQPVSASHIAGYSEYYILGDEEDILAALIEVNPYQTGPYRTQGPIRSRVSLIVIADGANVYLDDDDVGGYNFDPGNPSGTADASWLALNQGDVLTFTEAELDGGDRLYVTGAPVSVVRTVWAESPGPYLAGSWELYPLLAWQNSYVVPVGEDLDFAPDSTLPFEYTFLFIEAAQDNTQVTVTDPPTGVSTVITLNRGENTYLPDINAGTTVVATGPIQAGLITSVNEVWDSRYYTLTPEEFLCNEYYLPVPSMQFPAGEFGGRDVDTAAYIYAFQDNTTVTIQNGTGLPTTVPLDAGEVYRYVMPRIPRGTTEGPYGAQVTADNQIWILVAGDDDNPDLDWGYQAMCPSFLDDGYYLPFAPANPAHVTPMDDNTTFFVDWNSDGVVDETFTLDRLDTRMLYAPGPGYDATGAHIYADGRFAIAWGQDNTERTPGEPLPDYDYGYTILPLEPVEWLSPVLAIEKTVDPPSLPAEGGAVQFTLVVSTGDYPVYNVDISDVLPVGWEYVYDSTSIDLSYDSDGSGPAYDPSISGDPVSGYTLVWDLNGLGLNDTMPANSTIVLTYQARTIPGAYSAGLHDNLAQAYGEDENGAIFRPEDHAFVSIPELPALSLAKASSAGGLVNAGDTITYTIVISNVGTAAATGVTVSDTLPANTTWADNVTIAPPSAGGTAGNPPIIASGMTVEAGARVTVTFAVAVNTPLPAGVDTITNTACVNSTEIITPVCDTVTDSVEKVPGIELAKTVYLGRDGGAGCPGSEIVTGTIGTEVTYCFEVTNTGETYLDSIVITDTALGIPPATVNLQADMSDPYPPLAPGESLVYYYEGNISGDLVNTAETEGRPTDPDGNPLPGPYPTDADDAEVDQIGPGIELAKTVYLGRDGGAGCPGGELVTGAEGADVTYCFEVTNTGNTYLGNIVITDTALGIPPATVTLRADMSAPYPPLAPGDSLVYYYETLINGDLVNTASTSGNPTDSGNNVLPGFDDPTDDDTAAVEIRLTPTPTPEPSGPEAPGPEPPTSTPTPISAAPVIPTPTVEVLTVARLPETGGFPGWFTVVLGVPILIGAASLLSLALLGMRGRRGDGKED